MDWDAPDFIGLHARSRPDALAFVDLASGRRWSYRDLYLDVGRAAAALRGAYGVGAGDRVAALAGSSVDLLIVSFACARLGAIFAPLNWRLAPAEIEVLLADCTPRLLLCDAASPRARFDGQTASMDEMVAAVAAAEPLVLPAHDADLPSILLYTSGTSGRPKGVIISEANAFFTALNFGVLGGVTNTSVLLCDSPMFHVIGLITNVRPALMQGAAMLVSARFDPALTNQRLGDPALGVTHYFCVPQMAQMLRDQPDFDPARLTGLTGLFTGGAPNPAANVRWWLANGVRMIDGYGMTEGGTLMGMPVGDDALLLEKAGSAGVPGPAVAVRIVDGRGEDVADGVIGELWVKGPNVSRGYWGLPDETAKAFSPDGWLRTGDVGRRDADGFATLVDRIKDMFISGGENVYPVEVEAVLLDHPAVAEAAVVGVADVRWGEVGYAFVVVRDGAEVEDAELAALCAERIARYKAPKRFVRMDALPRAGSGKVLKHVLRATV